MAEYVDEGVSGASTSRPGFDAMMRAAQAGKFEHLLNSLDLLAGWGVSFCSVRDPGIDTTSAHGRLLLQLLAVFASYERELIKGRVSAGVRRAQAAGRHASRCCPRVVDRVRLYERRVSAGRTRIRRLRLTAADGAPVSWNAFGETTTDHRGADVDRAGDGAEIGIVDPSGVAMYAFARAPGGEAVEVEDLVAGGTRSFLWGPAEAEFPVSTRDETNTDQAYVGLEGMVVGRLEGGTFTPMAQDAQGGLLLDGIEFLEGSLAFGEGAGSAPGSAERRVWALLGEGRVGERQRAQAARPVRHGRGSGTQRAGGPLDVSTMAIRSIGTPYKLPRRRLYDEDTGRFASQDPIGLGGGDHRFAYVSGNPLGGVDPSGLVQMDPAGGNPGRVGEGASMTISADEWQAFSANQAEISGNNYREVSLLEQIDYRQGPGLKSAKAKRETDSCAVCVEGGRPTEGPQPSREWRGGEEIVVTSGPSPSPSPSASPVPVKTTDIGGGGVYFGPSGDASTLGNREWKRDPYRPLNRFSLFRDYRRMQSDLEQARGEIARKLAARQALCESSPALCAAQNKAVYEVVRGGAGVALSGCGLVPALGTACDAADGAISLGEGDKLGAAASGAGIVFEGATALKLAKNAKRLADGLDALHDLDKAAEAAADAKKADKLIEGAGDASRGTIYKVPGDATPSGKPYIGRHNQPNPAKTRRSTDGRDRTKAEVVGEYDAADVAAGRKAEQGAMNAEGGVGNLDNRRNEIAPEKWEANGIESTSTE